MLFHNSIRKELARTFGATLVVLVTVVMTMTVIRTLGEASRGVFNPSDVIVIMGYTVLADLPTILALCLFIAIINVLTRMYRDSEMVIWFGSGRGLLSLLKPISRFAWPIFVVIFLLAFLVLPWAFSRIEDLRDTYEKRSDLARVEPGQFQESSNGNRVFFLEKDPDNKPAGSNVFMATREQGKETISSALSAKIEVIGQDKFLVLENGQRLEKSAGKADYSITTFDRYVTKIGVDDSTTRSYLPTSTMTTLQLFIAPSLASMGEFSWRAGLILTAFNLMLIALASAGSNPRAGRTGNLFFAFMVFVLYFNFLILGRSWVESGKVPVGLFLLLLHGGALGLGLLMLAARHNQWANVLFKRSPQAATVSGTRP